MEKAPYNSRMSEGEDRYHQERARIEQGHVKYRDKLKAEGKLFVRERLKRLLDPGSDFEEDWLFARSQEADTPADGVVTGVGRVGGRPVCIMANDYTVKAGSWGEKTVQKIIRIQEKAARLNIPLLYMVDAAGGRISEQIRIFPGRFHAGRIFYNEVQLSVVVSRAPHPRATGRPEARARDRRDRAVRPAEVVRHVRSDRPGDRRGLVVGAEAALRPGNHQRLRADRGPDDRHRREPAEGQGR